MNFLRKNSKKDLVKEIHITSGTTAAIERCATYATDDNCQLNLHQPEPAACNINALKVCLKVQRHSGKTKLSFVNYQ